MADRFFVQVRDGAGQYEFSANVDVDATVDLESTIGFVKVGALGDASANPVDGTAFTITAADLAQPMLVLESYPGLAVSRSPVARRSPSDARSRRRAVGSRCEM